MNNFEDAASVLIAELITLKSNPQLLNKLSETYKEREKLRVDNRNKYLKNMQTSSTLDINEHNKKINDKKLEKLNKKLEKPKRENQSNLISTPSSNWSKDGKEDPHKGHYDVERASLSLGKLTDDELANAAFLNYNAPLNIDGIINGTHYSPICYMTAVKDRIRWLSRSLERVLKENNELKSKAASLEGKKS
jgi:hypothetical protein